MITRSTRLLVPRCGRKIAVIITPCARPNDSGVLCCFAIGLGSEGEKRIWSRMHALSNARTENPPRNMIRATHVPSPSSLTFLLNSAHVRSRDTESKYRPENEKAICVTVREWADKLHSCFQVDESHKMMKACSGLDAWIQRIGDKIKRRIPVTGIQGKGNINALLTTKVVTGQHFYITQAPKLSTGWPARNTRIVTSGTPVLLPLSMYYRRLIKLKLEERSRTIDVPYKLKPKIAHPDSTPHNKLQSHDHSCCWCE